MWSGHTSSDTEISSDPPGLNEFQPEFYQDVSFLFKQNYENPSYPSFQISENSNHDTTLPNNYIIEEENKIKGSSKIGQSQKTENTGVEPESSPFTHLKWPTIVQQAATKAYQEILSKLTSPKHKFDKQHNFVYLREILRQIVGQTYHRVFQRKYINRRNIGTRQEYLKLLKKFLVIEFDFSKKEIDQTLKFSKLDEEYFILNMFFSPFQMKKVVDTSIRSKLHNTRSMYMDFTQQRYHQNKGKFFAMLGTQPAIQFYLRDIFKFVINQVRYHFKNLPDGNKEAQYIYDQFNSFYLDIIHPHAYKAGL